MAFVLTLLFGVCFLSVNARVAVISGKGGASEFDLPLTQKIMTSGDNAALQGERTPSGAIQGVVIDGRTRRPIAGASVSLERGRVPVDRNPRTKEPSVRILTNELGRFRFERIEPGVYRFMAAKRGYLSSYFSVIEVEPGKTTTREILLDPLARFSGRVLDESNHPVREARVIMFYDARRPSAALRRLLDEQGASALVTTTNHQGEFDLFVPAEEEGVTLVALALGYAPSRLGPFSVRSVRARTGIALGLSRGLEAQGRVVGENGAPIQGATIFAHNLKLGRARLGLENVEPRTISGADGRFVLRGLEKSAYILKASRDGHATCTVPDVEIQSQSVNQLSDIVLLTEVEFIGRVTDTEGQPIPGAKISGVLGEENSSEAFSNNDGSFVLSGFASGARVILSATADGYSKASKVVSAPDRDVVLILPRHGVLRGRVEDAETLAPVKEFQIVGAEAKSFRSADGTFELKELRAGEWSFVARATGYQAKVVGVEIRAGQPTEGVIFSLARGVELSGRVVDAETGTGLPNITVSYHLATQVERHTRNLRFFSNRQITDSDGNFKFDGLPREKVTIITLSEFHPETRRTVVVEEERFLEIRLSKGGSISGRVLGLDATPLPGARVTLWSVASESGITIPADEAGTFSFSYLAAGRYQLTADTKYGLTKPEEIVLSENEHLRHLVLAAKTGATIRGRVTGLGSSELPRVDIIGQGQGGFESITSTDSDGTFAIHGVPKGLIRVTAQTSSQRLISKSLDIQRESPELNLDIEFPRLARLSGRVTRGGQPVAYQMVEAFPSNPESVSGSGKTDQNGMYTIEGLSEGDYVVNPSGERRNSLRISGDTVLNIELPVLSLSGRFLDANSGQPLSEVTVQVQRVSPVVDSSIYRTAITDTLGRFSVERLEPGQYRLVAHKRGFKVGMETLSIPASSEPILSLTPAEGITIRVKDGISGFALRAVTVQTFSGAQGLHLNVALDETGGGELPQLTPGRYNLHVSASGYAPKYVLGWTVPGSTLDITLTPGGRLEIHADSAYTGAKVSLVDANGVPPSPAQTEFTLSQPIVFPHLAPGEYTFLVKLPEQTKRYKTSISEGQITVLQVK